MSSLQPTVETVLPLPDQFLTRSLLPEDEIKAVRQHNGHDLAFTACIHHHRLMKVLLLLIDDLVNGELVDPAELIFITSHRCFSRMRPCEHHCLEKVPPSDPHRRVKMHAPPAAHTPHVSLSRYRVQDRHRQRHARGETF